MTPSTVRIREFGLLTGTLPGPVGFVLSDAADEENAQVWITARFELQSRTDDKLAVIAQAALHELQRLIDEGIEAAKAPPRSIA